MAEGVGGMRALVMDSVQDTGAACAPRLLRDFRCRSLPPSLVVEPDLAQIGFRVLPWQARRPSDNVTSALNPDSRRCWCRCNPSVLQSTRTAPSRMGARLLPAMPGT